MVSGVQKGLMFFCAPEHSCALLVFACLTCWKLSRKVSSGTLGFQPEADAWICPGKQAREALGEPELREQHLALLLGCLRREKGRKTQ